MILMFYYMLFILLKSYKFIFHWFVITAIPLEALAQNSMVSMVLTSYGGHIGFVEGITIHKSNYMERLFSQFAKGIFELGKKDKLKEILEDTSS